MNIRKKFIKYAMQALLGGLAFLARRPRGQGLLALSNRLLAGLMIRSKGIREARDLMELGKMWQKGFASAKQVPITGTDQTTLYAEIHTPCPLRGSGDLHACYLMMAYDRQIVKAAGGEFEVLSSQATPGNTFCKVAMKKTV